MRGGADNDVMYGGHGVLGDANSGYDRMNGDAGTDTMYGGDEESAGGQDIKLAAAYGDYMDGGAGEEPDGLRLHWQHAERMFASQHLPLVVGRSPQAAFCVDDNRVSRSHCRIDWHGGSFQLTDLSFNGTCVRFADGEIVSLRRGSCTLHGSGTIGLGGTPLDSGTACVDFEVLRFSQTATRPVDDWLPTQT